MPIRLPSRSHPSSLHTSQTERSLETYIHLQVKEETMRFLSLRFSSTFPSKSRRREIPRVCTRRLVLERSPTLLVFPHHMRSRRTQRYISRRMNCQLRSASLELSNTCRHRSCFRRELTIHDNTFACFLGSLVRHYSAPTQCANRD